MIINNYAQVKKILWYHENGVQCQLPYMQYFQSEKHVQLRSYWKIELHCTPKSCISFILSYLCPFGCTDSGGWSETTWNSESWFEAMLWMSYGLSQSLFETANFINWAQTVTLGSNWFYIRNAWYRVQSNDENFILPTSLEGMAYLNIFTRLGKNRSMRTWAHLVFSN